jgi:hypothetical protein
MWQLILFTLGMIALAIWVHKIAKKKKSPAETFVCDVCGKKDCICHKQE